MKDIKHLGNDLRKWLHQSKENAKMALASEIIDDAAQQAPVDTGRLYSSGFAYVDGKFVAQSPSVQGPIFSHHEPRTEEDLIQFVFSTPKPAGENAKVFYTKGGKWFDYAGYQAEHHVSQAMWIDTVIRVKTLPIIDREFRRLW